MKLGLIYHQFVRRGGLENYLIELSGRLQAAGHELELVANEVAPDVQTKLNCPIHHIPLVKGSPMMRMWQFGRVAARVAENMSVDTTIGFGRTYSHELHRAGGGCHAIYSKLLPWWK